MLRFLSKVTFLTNIIFGLVIAMHWMKNISNWDQDLVSILVVTAYFIAIPLNIIINICTLTLLIQRKKAPLEMWIQIFNAVFLIIQIAYFQFS